MSRKKSKFTEGYYVLTRPSYDALGNICPNVRVKVGWLSQSTAMILFRQPPKGGSALYKRLGFTGWEIEEPFATASATPRLNVAALREPMDGAR